MRRKLPLEKCLPAEYNEEFAAAKLESNQGSLSDEAEISRLSPACVQFGDRSSPLSEHIGRATFAQRLKSKSKLTRPLQVTRDATINIIALAGWLVGWLDDNNDDDDDNR